MQSGNIWIKAGGLGSTSSNLAGLGSAIGLHASSKRVEYVYKKVVVLAGVEIDYEIDRLPDDIPRRVLSESLRHYNSCIQSYVQVLPALAVFCRHDEAGVREKYVNALANIGIGMNESDMAVHFIPMIMGLAGDKNLAVARVCACKLLFIPYATSSASSKVELLSKYAALCRDVNPLVRREAALNLWRFAKADNGHFEQDVKSLLEHLVQEDADESVRSAAIQSCGALRDVIEPPVFMKHILPLILAGYKDTSPIVHEMAANHLCEVDIEDKKAAFAFPIPTLPSVLAVIAVGAFVYGTYRVVVSIETNGKEVVRQLTLARESWTAKGSSIKVYPQISWK